MNMAPGLEKFSIILDEPDSTFAPGQTIAGRIIVHLSRIKCVKGLKVCVRGQGEVGWCNPAGTHGHMTSYLNDEEYMKIEFYLLGDVDTEKIEIQPGEHQYQFNFTLPENIPSSFVHKHGRVYYTIKAVLERPWKFDHQTDLVFPVEAPFDLSLYPPAMNPIDDEEQKPFYCFPCFRMGSMKFRVYVPTSGFAVDETIEAKIDIDNNSTHVDVTKIEMNLEQIIKVQGHSTVNQIIQVYKRGHTKKSTHIVQTTERFRPFDKTASVDISLKVPPLPSSNLVHCNIIDVKYRLNVEISVSNCQAASRKSYPIAIGRKPDPSPPEAQNDYKDSVVETVN